MILLSRAQFGEDSKEPPEQSAVRRGLQRTPRAENTLGAPNSHRTKHRTPKGRSESRNYIPGHALHEKGLQKQKGVVPLVGSQEQRAPLVPLINR